MKKLISGPNFVNAGLKGNELEVTQWEETPRKSLKKHVFPRFHPLFNQKFNPGYIAKLVLMKKLISGPNFIRVSQKL